MRLQAVLNLVYYISLNMKKYLKYLSYTVIFLFFTSAGIAFALPIARYEQNLFPFVTDKYDLGSTTPSNRWFHIFTKYSSTTALTISDQSTGCAQFDSTGFITSTGVACGSGSGSVVYDWKQQTDTFSVNALTPTSTIPIWIKSTATSSFAGGIEAWGKIGAPYFNATSTTATSTFAKEEVAVDLIQM